MEVRVEAPAKVNLHLEVLAARADGYHDLVSLVQAVDLADSLRLVRTGRDGPVSLRGMSDCEPASNLVVRAIELFRRRAGTSEGVAATIRKRIPIGAGYGGGSSDAAAALRGCMALFGSPLDAATLRDCALCLGSDVPFFLHGPVSVVEGRGERVRVLRARTDFAIVAATPEARVSTADAFAWLDEDRGASPYLESAARGASPYLESAARGASPYLESAARGARALARAYRRLPPGAWPFGNSFDGPVRHRRDAVAALCERMRACGAAAPRLTGSGSTVIAVFADADVAHDCARALAAAPPPGTARGSIRVLRPLASFPDVLYYG